MNYTCDDDNVLGMPMHGGGVPLVAGAPIAPGTSITHSTDRKYK